MKLTDIPNIQDDNLTQLLTKTESQSVTLTSANRKKEYQVIEIKLNIWITLCRARDKLVTSNIKSFNATKCA